MVRQNSSGRELGQTCLLLRVVTVPLEYIRMSHAVREHFQQGTLLQNEGWQDYLQIQQATNAHEGVTKRRLRAR